MASTFVDNYTITDFVNSTTPSGDTPYYAYSATQSTTTIDTDTYIPTSSSTHTIPSASRRLVTGAILDDGINGKALYQLLLMIQVNWDNAMRQLDDTGGVGTTDYESVAAIGPLDGDYTAAFAVSTAGLALLDGSEAAVIIHPNGVDTRRLAIFFQAIATQFAACTAALDADATLTDTNYASTLDIDFTTKTGWLPVSETATPFTIYGGDDTNYPNASSKIQVNGIDAEALVDYLNTVVTNINLLWVKLDADI